MMANKLSLNFSKSNMILIQTKNLYNKVKSSPVTLTVNTSKYLGVLLDNF